MWWWGLTMFFIQFRSSLYHLVQLFSFYYLCMEFYLFKATFSPIRSKGRKEKSFALSMKQTHFKSLIFLNFPNVTEILWHWQN